MKVVRKKTIPKAFPLEAYLLFCQLDAEGRTLVGHLIDAMGTMNKLRRTLDYKNYQELCKIIAG